MRITNLKYQFIFSIFLCIVLMACDRKAIVENQAAEARIKDYRSVTVINNLSEKLIKECNLTTESGVMVKHTNKETTDNIVFKDFDKDSAFENETNFKITLIDRYGLKYEKPFIASSKGNTDVVINDSNYVKQSFWGDLKRKIEKAIN